MYTNKPVHINLLCNILVFVWNMLYFYLYIYRMLQLKPTCLVREGVHKKQHICCGHVRKRGVGANLLKYFFLRGDAECSET